MTARRKARVAEGSFSTSATGLRRRSRVADLVRLA